MDCPRSRDASERAAVHAGDLQRHPGGRSARREPLQHHGIPSTGLGEVRLRRLVLAALTGVACSQGGAPAPPAPAGAQRAAPANGEDLLRRMHDEYATTWYATLTFVQTATFADGRTETWYEALQLPGRLRIDVAPVTGGNATIFRNDSVFSFAGGKRERSGAFVHPLLVLGFDVYRAPVEETIAKVRGFRVDLSKLHSSTWQGRPVWIVGADAGDSVPPSSGSTRSDWCSSGCSSGACRPEGSRKRHLRSSTPDSTDISGLAVDGSHRRCSSSSTAVPGCAKSTATSALTWNCRSGSSRRTSTGRRTG